MEPACRRTTSHKDCVWPGAKPANAAATARLECIGRRSARLHEATGVNKIHHSINKKTVTGYKQKGLFDATPPGIIPGTTSSPLRVRAAPPWYWTWCYTTWNYPGNSWLPTKGLGRYTPGIFQDVIPPGISPSTEGKRSPDYSPVPPSISAVLSGK